MVTLFFSVLGIAIAVFVIRNIYVGIVSAPYAATPKHIIRKALEISELKPGEQFYDLGSGDGRALILAAGEFGARATGFELSWQWYCISKINVAWHGFSKTAKIFLKDFSKEPLGDSDVIFCWLSPRVFKKIEEKFNKELKTGGRIVTFSSPLPTWKPEKTFAFSETARLFLYRRT